MARIRIIDDLSTAILVTIWAAILGYALLVASVVGCVGWAIWALFFRS